MSAGQEQRDAFPEPLPGIDATGALRVGFERRRRASGETAGATALEVQKPAPVAGKQSYDLEGEIARGGMGVIVKARDRELGRDVALKVLRDELAGEPKQVQRFLEEARVTARLDHPGIVPVHEVGRDAAGRPFFAMRLVRGRELRRIIELAHTGSEGWSQTRALSVIQKVCEAMAYAHDKGVIHRDLKPSNVMVGEFGEVYVMDWGLARMIDGEDTHDLRLRAVTSASARSRAQGAGGDPRDPSASPAVDSPIVTMDGEVLGTPCYMAPEQAQGRIAELGPRSDVYAVGAMLYHLLAGEMPYVPAGTSVGSRKVLLSLVQGPPRALDEIRPDVPVELVAICDKAMARDPSERYPSMLSMAEDLRAFLERRVVRAYETGAWAQARKWVQRNKALSGALSLAAAALVAGLVASLALKAQSDANFVRAEDSARAAGNERDRALKIASFLEDTLAAVGPSVARGRDTAMLREMMDAAWTRIQKGELAAAPQAELRLMLVIGGALREIGQYETSAAVLRLALEKARRLYPGDDPLLARTETQLGMLLRDRGDLDGAERLHREALAMNRRLFPSDEPEIAANLENLASVLEARGDHAAAEASLREALAMNRRLFTTDQREVAINLINLGVVLQARGDLGGAEACFRQAIEIQERLFPGDHPEVAMSLDNLAEVLAAKHDLRGSEEFHRRALDMRRRILPPDHLDLATSLNNLAAALQARDDLAGAEPLYREALAILRRHASGDDARVSSTLGNLATLLHARGDLDGAEPLYREGLEMERRLFPGDHDLIARSLSNLSSLFAARGDLEQAETTLREAFEMERRLFKGDHPDVAHIEDALALLLQRRGDPAGAEPLFRDALEMEKRIYVDNPYPVASGTYNLARVLKARDDFAAAEPLLREALRLYGQVGADAGADIATAEVELGQVLTRLARFAQAEEVLLDAADALERHPHPNPAWLEACVQRLLDNYAAWDAAEPGRGHADGAEDWKRKQAELGKK
jgi:serine/threonine-protein kinase